MDSYEREYGWEDTIEKDSEFVIVPEGDYVFKVESFERGRFPGSDKMPACNKAMLRIIVSDTSGKITTVINHNLLLHSRCEWSLSEFFAGIGQKKKGEKLRMDWNRVTGASGTCKVGVKTYNGNEYNEIKKFYPKDPSYSQRQGNFTGKFNGI